MTEAQEKSLRRLNGIYGKLIQEEDYKGALTVQMQIITFERSIELGETASKQRELSPLR